MKVLIVDDDVIFSKGLRILLENENIYCELAANSEECFEKLRSHKDFDVILLDQILPDTNGIEILQDIRLLYPQICIILMTMYGEASILQKAIANGIDGYIEKPFDIQTLYSTLDTALSARKSRVSFDFFDFSRSVPPQYLMNVLNGLPGGLIIVNLKYEPQIINERAFAILGLNRDEIDAELIRKTFFEKNEVSRSPIRQTKRVNSKMIGFTLIPFYYLSKRAGTLINFQDITKDYRKKRKIQQKKRLALLGSIASGIAHEIGNPIAAMKTTLQFVLENFKELPSTKIEELLKKMFREINHIEFLIRDFLTYARYRPPIWKRFSISEILLEVADELRETMFSKNIKIVIDKPRFEDKVWVDIAMAKQIFRNILINAIEACDEDGKIYVSFKNRNEAVIVKVKDNGIGIKRENLKKVFEPFFTTRANGTGLGLAISLELMRQMHGQIKIRSEPNRGTCVYLKFTKRNPNYEAVS